MRAGRSEPAKTARRRPMPPPPADPVRRPPHSRRPADAGIVPHRPAPDAAVDGRARGGAQRRRSRSCARCSTRFDGCALKATATQLVFADGNPQARVMFVGEAPGRDEDIEGLPFVGRSGKLLDRMLAAIGLDRTRSTSPTSCPGGRPATARRRRQETQICLPFIARQIELADPDILVCARRPVGADAAADLRGHHPHARPLVRLRHRDARSAPCATFHPAYLLRSPLAKRLAWRDFLAIKKALDNAPATRPRVNLNDKDPLRRVALDCPAVAISIAHALLHGSGFATALGSTRESHVRRIGPSARPVRPPSDTSQRRNPISATTAHQPSARPSQPHRTHHAAVASVNPDVARRRHLLYQCHPRRE